MKSSANTFRLAACVAVFAVLSFFIVTGARAEVATPDEARLVAENWLTLTVNARGTWGGERYPTITGVEQIIVDGNTLGYAYTVAPIGFIIVPALKEMSPVKGYSWESDLDLSRREGYTLLIKQVLDDRASMYIEKYGSLEAAQPAAGDVLLGRVGREKWDVFAVDPKRFEAGTLNQSLGTRAFVGPLLTSSWHQWEPYNLYAPSDAGGKCPVGCVATAAAIIFHYWQWPTEGIGSHTYTWNGVGVPAQTFTADFWDTYEFGLMPDDCPYPSCGDLDQDYALAELNWEIGVAFEMDYGSDGSGVSTAALQFVINQYVDHFLYKPTIVHEHRLDWSSFQWWNLITSDLNAGRPLQYFIEGHSIVCDGWSDEAGVNQYHMNYGWDDGHNSWYVIDELYPDDMNPIYESMFRGIEPNQSVMFSATPRIGWAPMAVDFAGSSEFTVDGWLWDFGDTGDASESSPQHTYTESGMFDVNLQVESGGEFFDRTKTKYVIALADTLEGDSCEIALGEMVEVVIYGSNTVPVKEIKIPVEYDGPLSLKWVVDSFSTIGCRTDYFEEVVQTHYSSSYKRMSFKLTSSLSGTSPDLEPGSGPILKLYFQIDGGASFGQETPIMLDGYSANIPWFSGDLAEYQTATLAGKVGYYSCCRGIRGNVDEDPEQAIDISDLVYLVDYMFGGGPDPTCFYEANIDGDFMGDLMDQIAIDDLVYLVEYMFSGGPEPPSCP